MVRERWRKARERESEQEGPYSSVISRILLPTTSYHPYSPSTAPSSLASPSKTKVSTIILYCRTKFIRAIVKIFQGSPTGAKATDTSCLKRGGAKIIPRVWLSWRFRPHREDAEKARGGVRKVGGRVVQIVFADKRVGRLGRSGRRVRSEDTVVGKESEVAAEMDVIE